MIGSYPRTQQIRSERRARAEAVQLANKRTTKEQLAWLNKVGLVAERERAKIADKLRKEAQRGGK